jgi:hypothetical protein
MLELYYGTDGDAYSDFELDEIVEGLKGIDFSTENMIIYTSTENIIYKIKVAIYKGIIDPVHFRLHMYGRTLILDKTARPRNGHYPSTYLDDCLNTLIGL